MCFANIVGASSATSPGKTDDPGRRRERGGALVEMHGLLRGAATDAECKGRRAPFHRRNLNLGTIGGFVNPRPLAALRPNWCA